MTEISLEIMFNGRFKLRNLLDGEIYPPSPRCWTLYVELIGSVDTSFASVCVFIWILLTGRICAGKHLYRYVMCSGHW